MGFEMGPIGNKPIIRENQGTQDGGAGNLGYMKGIGEEDEKKQKNSLNKSIFEQSPDSYEENTKIIDEDSSDFSLSKLIAQIILFIKDLINKIIGKK